MGTIVNFMLCEIYHNKNFLIKVAWERETMWLQSREVPPIAPGTGLDLQLNYRTFDVKNQLKHH